MRVSAIGDLEVAYTERGSGRPVVLIHGLAEDRATWADQQADLDFVHTFAYDLRGHGETTLGAADATLEQLGRDLVGFLEEISGPAVVVGFSLGGTVALWAAAERPDLVERAVVLGTSSTVGRSATEFYRDRIALAVATDSSAFRAALRADTAAAVTVAHDQIDQIVEARLAAIGDGRGYVNAARAMASLNQAPLTPRLVNLTVHVDVIGADGDAFCPPRAAQIILEALPDASYYEITDAGHLMNIDNPHGVTEVLRATLKEWS